MRTALLSMLLLGAVAAAQDPEELTRLVAALNSAPATRAEAAAKLLVLSDPRTIPMVEAALPGFGSFAQATAIDLLRQFPDDEAGLALRRLLQAKAPHLRLCAALALCRSNEPELISIMADALDAPDLQRNDHAAMCLALGDLGALKQGGAAEALVRQERKQEFLEAFFLSSELRKAPDAVPMAIVVAETDKRLVPRALAAAYLVRHKKSDYAAILHETLAADGFSAQRFAQVQLILFTSVGARAGGPPEIAADVIAKAAATQKDGELVRQMMFYLRAVDSPKLQALCQRLIEHPSSVAALAAFAVLAGDAVRPSDEALQRVVANGPDAAALEAAQLLLVVDDTAGFARVLRCAQDNAALRGTAIRLLGQFRMPQAMDLLIAALDDSEFTIRQAAFGAITETLQKLYPYRRFRWPPALREFRAEPAERTAAVAQLRAWWARNRDADW